VGGRSVRVGVPAYSRVDQKSPGPGEGAYGGKEEMGWLGVIICGTVVSFNEIPRRN